MKDEAILFEPFALVKPIKLLPIKLLITGGSYSAQSRRLLVAAASVGEAGQANANITKRNCQLQSDAPVSPERSEYE